jgi:hypothetical protein
LLNFLIAAIPDLLREYLKVAISSNAAIPIPEQAVEPSRTDKILVRIPASLHIGVKNAAKRERTSVNQFAVKALTEAVTRIARPKLDATFAGSKARAKRVSKHV